MIQFKVWSEARDYKNIKNTVLSSLFPTLDQAQAEENLNITIDTIDPEIIDQMLNNGNIKTKLNIRDPHQFLQSRKGITIQQFIDWLLS